MAYLVGIDVSQRQVSICVLDQQGKRIWRGKCLTDPAVIIATLEEVGDGHGGFLRGRARLQPPNKRVREVIPAGLTPIPLT